MAQCTAAGAGTRSSMVYMHLEDYAEVLQESFARRVSKR